MLKIEHIGIAVNDLANSEEIFEKLLGYKHYKIEDVPSEGVKTAFYRAGEVKIELLEGSGPNNSIRKFIDKKGEGIHHIAFAVKDIQAEIQRLQDLGFDFIATTPKPGADNKLICFLHPGKTNGVLVELCQDIS